MSINLDIPHALVAGDSGIDAGVCDAVPVAGGAAGSRTLAEAGWYKIAAMNTPLQWKLGATDVTATTGAHLANGDQELVYVADDDTDITFIESDFSTAAGDGYLNIVKVGFKKVVFENPFSYDDP